MENFQEASVSVRTLSKVDAFNLASAGECEALEWTRKYLELYPPGEAELAIRDDNTGLRTLSESARAHALEYLAAKGDERYLEIVNQHDGDYGRLLATRIAGTNIFDSGDFGVQRFWGKMFIPSVANTGPQAVYVREILYRYWEEHGRESSKFPQELLTMVVSFDEDNTPVCSVDLAKYGLSVPIITPRPHKDIFHWWNEHDPWTNSKNTSTKLTVQFPDFAEPVEITPYMRVRHSPDWDGLYVHVPKKSPSLTMADPKMATSLPSADDTQPADTPPNSLWLYTALLAIFCATVALWLIRKKR